MEQSIEVYVLFESQFLEGDWKIIYTNISSTFQKVSDIYLYMVGGLFVVIRKWKLIQPGLPHFLV